jgi:hypothetical protein
MWKNEGGCLSCLLDVGGCVDGSWQHSAGHLHQHEAYRLRRMDGQGRRLKLSWPSRFSLFAGVFGTVIGVYGSDTSCQFGGQNGGS